VVVVLGAGGAGWAIFGGGGAGGNGNTGRPDSSGAVAQNTDSGRRTQTLANRDTGARRNLGGGAVPTPIDSAAIDRQLNDILDLVLDPQTRATGRVRATAIYDNERAPKAQRAAAAFMVAQAFFQEQRSDEACRWNGLALRLAPANETYMTFQRDQRCAA